MAHKTGWVIFVFVLAFATQTPGAHHRFAPQQPHRNVDAALLRTGQTETGQTTGRVTRLPLPRFVSLKNSIGYARRGPSKAYPIDWVFQSRAMPLKVIDEYQSWRRVQDRDGEGGWMWYGLLSPTRTVIVETHMIPLRARPDRAGRIVAYCETGVIAALETCTDDWCLLETPEAQGWVETHHLWGLSQAELAR